MRIKDRVPGPMKDENDRSGSSDGDDPELRTHRDIA
jgi:hypothetical protein